MRRQFKNDFKEMILDLLESGHRLTDISKEYDICTSVIRYWRKRREGNSMYYSGDKNGKISKEQLEHRRTRQALKEMTIERDILKKAVRIFSMDDRKHTSL